MKLVVYEYGVPNRRSPGQVIYAAEAHRESVYDLIPTPELRDLCAHREVRPVSDRPRSFEDRMRVWGKRRVSRFRRLLREGGAELDRRWVEYSVVEEWDRVAERARRGLGPGPGVLP